MKISARLGVALLMVGLGGWAAAEGRTPALDVALRGPIGPATADDVVLSLAAARARQSPLVILELDTPGGLESSMRAIVGAVLASPVPVACLVAPSGARAASAGTYILAACPIAAMAPGTTLGAATPVSLGGAEGDRQEATDPHRLKAVNDAAAYMRGLADLHGRNAAWLESAVRQAATLTADEAASQHVIDFVAVDPSDLLAKADGRRVLVAGRPATLATAGLTIEPLPTPWHSRLLAVITRPDIAYLLMLIGVYGLLFELINPGQILPGLAGAIALLVALYALGFLPLDYAGVALLGLGMLLMAVEPFVVSHGVVAVAGVVAFATGSLMMFRAAPPAFRLSLWVVAAATAGSVAGLVWMLGVAVRARRRPLVSGAETLLGAAGEVVDWPGPTGHVRVAGEVWRAAAMEPLAPGQPVVVTGRQGLVLEVRAARTGG